MPARFECYQAIQKMFREREIQEEKEKNFQDYLKGVEDEIQSLRNEVEEIRATIGDANEEKLNEAEAKVQKLRFALKYIQSQTDLKHIQDAVSLALA